MSRLSRLSLSRAAVKTSSDLARSGSSRVWPVLRVRCPVSGVEEAADAAQENWAFTGVACSTERDSALARLALVSADVEVPAARGTEAARRTGTSRPTDAPRPTDTSRPTDTPRRSRSRAELTRESLLDGARVVFCADGYADTSIAAVVEAARTSVGSLYHHFGGKADVYRALYERYQEATWRAATEAVSHARDAGEDDPVELFLAGAHAYLVRCRADADLTRLFLQGEGPAGFDALRRQVAVQWVRQNSRLIGAADRRNGDALVNVLTTVAASAGTEVAAAPDDRRAADLTDDFVDLLRRVATPSVS